MQKTRVVPSIVVVALVCLLIGMAQVGYAQSPDDDVFAVIKIGNLEELLPSITQFVDTFQPGMGGMVNPMMVGNMVFNNAEWTGMNMAGEYTAVVLNPMKFPQDPFAMILPLTNKDEYLGALSQTLPGGEEVEGVYNFTRPNQKPMFVAFAGDTGIMSDNKDVAAQVKMLVEGNSPVLQEVSAVTGQLQAFLAMDKILMAVSPMLDMAKQQLLMGVEMGMQQGMEDGKGEQPYKPEGVATIIQTEFDLLVSLLEQTKSLQIGIGIEDEGLRLSKAVFPFAGTKLEQFLAAQTPKKSPLLGYIPSDSAIIASTAMNFTPEFIDAYLVLVYNISAAAGTDAATIDKSVEMTRQYFKVIGEDTVTGLFSQSEEHLLTAIYSIKDTANVKELLGQYPQIFNTFTGMYKEMGIDMSITQGDTTEAAGGEILNYTFGMKADMIPDPEAQEMFTKIFGENMSMPIGLIENYAVAGFGKNAQPQVENVMTMLDSGEETAAQLTPGMFNLPEENNFFMYISAPKVLSWLVKMMPEAPPFDIVEGPGIGMASTVVDSHLEAQMYLPIAEIQAIQSMVMQAQMQGME